MILHEPTAYLLHLDGLSESLRRLVELELAPADPVWAPMAYTRFYFIQVIGLIEYN